MLINIETVKKIVLASYINTSNSTELIKDIDARLKHYKKTHTVDIDDVLPEGPDHYDNSEEQ